MSYKERPHPHQSSVLEFLPENYSPVRIDKKERLFGVISFCAGEWKIIYQKEVPAFGGYISSEENLYGSPTYCPNATRHHKKHLELYGTMPHLVFFDSEKTAKKAGFRKCKVCLP